MQCGGLDFGPPDATNLAALGQAMTRAGVAYEAVDAEEIRRRFPLLTPPDDVGRLLPGGLRDAPGRPLHRAARGGGSRRRRGRPGARAGARRDAERRRRRGADGRRDLPSGQCSACKRLVDRATRRCARRAAAADRPEGAARVLRARRPGRVRARPVPAVHPALRRLAHVRLGASPCSGNPRA